MSKLGYVVIEYNQASKWPAVWSDLLDTEDEAREDARGARAQTAEIGRGETYAIAKVELIEPHAAFVDPIEGGFAGYQAACWDCDWRDETIYDDKAYARAKADEHHAETTP